MRRSHLALPAALALAAGCATTSAPSAAGPARTEADGAPARPAAKPGEAPAAARPDAGDQALSPRAQRLFDEAVASIEEQRKLKVPTDWALVERKWRNVLDATDAAEAHYNLGVALERQGKLSEARDEYRRAVERKPGFRQAAVNLAVLQERDGDARGAAAGYARIASEFPQDAVSRERLAALYLDAGQTEEAWRLSREALLRDPGAVGAQKVMIRVAIGRNQLDLAKLMALRAQKLDDRDPELAFLDGQILARQGDDAAATARYRRALALDDGYPPARHALLDAAIRTESWVNVVDQARAVLKQEPKNAQAALALGVGLRHLGKPDEALAAYDEAQRLSGDGLPEVHLARGVLLMKVKNECEPAIAEFRAYARGAGPVLPGDAPAFKMQRECEQIVEENRKAAEAARQMQADAERKKVEDAAKKGAAPAGSTAAQGGAATPTSSPAPRR
jgi:tetratricopeptide (TPR) repeat protein